MFNTNENENKEGVNNVIERHDLCFKIIARRQWILAIVKSNCLRRIRKKNRSNRNNYSHITDILLEIERFLIT